MNKLQTYIPNVASPILLVKTSPPAPLLLRGEHLSPNFSPLSRREIGSEVLRHYVYSSDKLPNFPIFRFFFLIIFSVNSFGQNFINDKNEWFEGKIILERGDTLTGKMQYEMQTSILKLQTSINTIKTYSARQIDAFDFYDPILKEHRFFRTLMYTPKGKDYSTPSFFGLIFDGKGKISIYYKENLRNVYLWNTKTLANDDVEIYFGFPDGSMKRFRRHTNSLFDLLTENQQQLKDYIESKYLKTSVLIDMIRIVDYYNKLLPSELLEEN